MTQATAFNWKDRLRASAIHLSLSLIIASLAALLVFGLWYPYPHGDTAGGRELFMIVVSVDVVLGPLITLAVFNRRKPKAELVRDLAVVALIQLAALGYGLWTVMVARPVHIVFEVDRFRVVHAIEVPEELLHQTPPDVRGLPLTGPTVLAVRPFRDRNEETTATLAALQGLSLSARPDLWEPYPQARQRVLTAAKPVSELRRRFERQVAEIDTAVARSGRSADQLVYLPMVARKSFWTVLLDANSAAILGYVPLDSF